MKIDQFKNVKHQQKMYWSGCFFLIILKNLKKKRLEKK
jgi:hypothetical protein